MSNSVVTPEEWSANLSPAVKRRVDRLIARTERNNRTVEDIIQRENDKLAKKKMKAVVPDHVCKITHRYTFTSDGQAVHIEYRN